MPPGGTLKSTLRRIISGFGCLNIVSFGIWRSESGGLQTFKGQWYTLGSVCR
jgi:hypothetical protein